MADNTAIPGSLDPAAPKVLDREVAHSGDLAKLQYVGLGEATGVEGAYTFRAFAALDTLLDAINTLLTARLPAALALTGLKTAAAEVVLTAKVVSGNTVQAIGSDLAGLRNWGIMVPSTFDGTQIQFQMCDSFAGTYVPVYDITNTPVRLTVAASRYYDIPGELMGIRFLKIECLTAQAATDTDFLIIGKS